jgi:glycosyltransferase involved in cell wall biosynthesis
MVSVTRSQADLPATPRAESDRALVSVVVTTYARERLDDVLGLLRSLANQTYANVEIIFVGERVHELLTLVGEDAARNRIANLRVVFNDRPGLSQSRNLGAQLARGEIVAFIDDDAVAEPNWVEEIVATFSRHPSSIGVTGEARPLWEDTSMGWFPEEFFWIISCPVPAWTGTSSVQPVRNAWGINMAFRMEAFDLCQFSTSFGVSNRGYVDGIKLGIVGDDTEFCFRLRQVTGRPILYNPLCRVRHKVRRDRLTARSIRRRAFWEGYTKATLTKICRQSEFAEAFSLSSEFIVLRRILFRFLPRLLKQFPRSPRRAWRMLRLAVVVFLNFAAGYLTVLVPRPGIVFARFYSKL